MAFTVEDGTGLAAANAYVTVEEANAYHRDRGNTGWTGAGSAKQAAIVRATQFIESMYSWSVGYKLTEDQALGWPRSYATDADGYAVDADVVPEKVKQATAELALRALTADLIPDSERLAVSKTVGPISVTYEQSTSGTTGLSLNRRYPIADGLLRGLAVTKQASLSFPDIVRG